MRILITFVGIVFAITLQAQTTLPVNLQENIYGNSFRHSSNLHDSIAAKKWFLTKYTGISAGYTFFNHGGGSFLSVPVGLQLNHRLNNNVYAFAGVTVAPTYLSFNCTFLSTDLNKVNTPNSFYQPGKLSMYSAATLGLMYINDARTFSVSGSISVERNSYPFYYNNRFYTTKQNSTMPSFR
jgi:hypothetical protein